MLYQRMGKGKWAGNFKDWSLTASEVEQLLLFLSRFHVKQFSSIQDRKWIDNGGLLLSELAVFAFICMFSFLYSFWNIIVLSEVSP